MWLLLQQLKKGMERFRTLLEGHLIWLVPHSTFKELPVAIHLHMRAQAEIKSASDFFVQISDPFRIFVNVPYIQITWIKNVTRKKQPRAGIKKTDISRTTYRYYAT